MSARTRRVGGPLRRCLGWILVVAAIAAAGWSLRLDWGLAPVVWVPALVLAVVGWGLHTTRRLELDGERLTVHREGLLAGREDLVLDHAVELELLPTAGLRAVVLHRDGRALPLATWIGARRAEALIAWLEAGLGRALPRRAPERHRLDV